MQRYTILFALLVLAAAPIAGQVDFRVIGAAQQIDKIMQSDFYIAEIRDDRDFKANLGIVNRGADFDIKRPLIAEISFFENLKSRLNGWLLHEEKAVPVVLRIKELYLWESLHREREKGTGYIRLNLAFEAPGKPAQTIAVTLSGEHLTVAKGHSPRMEDAFFRCLQHYQERWENGRFQAEAKPDNLAAEGAGLKAVANFLDLKKGRHVPFPGKLKRLLGRQERFKLRNRQQREHHAYYAFIDGNEWFIRGDTYPGGDSYYTRVLEKGRFLFLVDKVRFPLKSTFTEQGIPSGKTVGILIDMKTGLPQIVTDELVAALIEPYPDLKKKYLFQNILEYPVQLERVRKVIAEVNSRR